MNEPRLYVIAAPSGGGKTSLIQALLRKDKRIRLSVSHTTRPPRPGEIDGVHYHFVSDQEFLELFEEGAFLETARVFDYRYGTGKATVEQQLKQGYDILLDIDWQGARQIRSVFPSCFSIFIIPPSLEALRQRLFARGQDSSEVIQRRMQDARDEISHWDEFDYLVVNKEFKAALAELHAVIRGQNTVQSADAGEKMETLAELLGTG